MGERHRAESRFHVKSIVEKEAHDALSSGGLRGGGQAGRPQPAARDVVPPGSAVAHGDRAGCRGVCAPGRDTWAAEPVVQGVGPAPRDVIT